MIAPNDNNPDRPHLVVVGNGMVGHRFCEEMVARDGQQQFRIHVFCEEPRLAYDRVGLSKYFSGTPVADLMLGTIEWYQEHGIETHIGDRATAIQRQQGIVTSQRGEAIAYDRLVLATGSAPFVPPIDGVAKEGVFVYRTIEDLAAIAAYGQKARRALVLGGGLLGLEAAKALVDMGLETTVVEFNTRLMPRQIDHAASSLLVEEIEALGVEVLLGKGAQRFLGDAKVTAVSFGDDEERAFDMVVISTGIRPRDELARECGLEIGERGGVVVNDALTTSDPHIHAIGEVALHRGITYGLVAPGYDMAAILAERLCGPENPVFTSGDFSTKLKLMGVDVANFGDAFGQTPGSRVIYFHSDVARVYKRLTVSGEHLLGGMLVGDASEYNHFLQMVKNKTPLPGDPHELLLGASNGKAVGFNPHDLPDDAQICSCNNVAKGALVRAVAEGYTQLGPLKDATRAGTGCGGCIPLVTDILNAELAAQGLEVNTHLCEHFSYSRQELFQIVKINRIKRYDDLLARYGQGYGCEICKPAVASILASTWNDLILEQEELQDTNDRFLANIQRGGTYSVIPRVPGGEITPAKLIVLGQVAQKYDLYCKITGGQRVDLLGARVDQLPFIWEELIAAGFESGHAYGKALRTVKSCVGTTWCRYAVQDSTGFAIRIEERYRGIRAPHKVKAACSGCVRECAEAQGKDFGLVATEKGWNLHVCGNGGAKPQHGVLLAADLDEETCIKYIDRFLMYYIHTADKLTRTATWFNQLEGGIEYLRRVIIDDHLGICAQLEEDMTHLVATYQCEWKAVVEDPERRKRFRHFVNSDDADDNLQWTHEREQKRPVNWEIVA